MFRKIYIGLMTIMMIIGLIIMVSINPIFGCFIAFTGFLCGGLALASDF